jgi:aspartate/methionine/tyrosine aminotransferase
MQIKPFRLERYFAEYEFKVEYLLSPSDCESLRLGELLELADSESLRLWHGLRLGYTESPGHPLLRAEIARLYLQIHPEQVVVAVPEEAIFIAMHTLLGPGDHAIVISPAYQSLYEIARAIGCQVTAWPVELSASGWQLDLDRLASSLQANTRLLVVNFPHNPTGYLASQAEFAAIVEIAREHDLYLFSDEMYRLLEYDPDSRLPAACDLYEKAISLSGLSKTFALPGLRLGWLATQDPDLPARWLAFKDYTTICHSGPSEILGIIALRAKERIVQRSLEIVRSNLEHAGEFFVRRPDRFRWIPPQAGSIAFPAWMGGGPVEAFCQRVLDEQGVMIVPGSIFEFPGDHFRVGLGRKNFPEALARLERYLA